jgi:hypothetical protein
VTATLSTDVAVVPLIWVAPLLLYLATFAIAFARRPLVSLAAANVAMPLVVLPLVIVAATPVKPYRDTPVARARVNRADVLLPLGLAVVAVGLTMLARSLKLDRRLFQPLVFVPVEIDCTGERRDGRHEAD